MDEKEIDIGNDHTMRFAKYQDEICAIRLFHLTPEGKECVGFIPFEGRTWARTFSSSIEAWRVVQENPLTLEPSIQCRACADHGYIRDGKWVKA